MSGQPVIDLEVEDTAWVSDVADVMAVVKRAANAALGSGDAAIVVLLTDDEVVRDLNARFRGKDRPTNVLSFPGVAPVTPDQPKHLGDIVLAHGVCAREAAEQDKTLASHLTHLVIHGVLHLRGHDHETDAEAEAMEAIERGLLAGLGIADPYSVPADS